MTKLPEGRPLDALLKGRVSAAHLRQRLGQEADKESHVFTRGRTFFHIENWYSIHSLIKNTLRLGMMLGRGRKNALALTVSRNEIFLPHLPAAFEGYTILHLSDLHLDINGNIPLSLIEKLREVDYDLCVMTGDYRAKTFGPINASLDAMADVVSEMKSEVYGILGNHDSLRMVPALESIGVNMLLNETVEIDRGGERIQLSGIDDPHYYRVDNIEKAAEEIDKQTVSILLSHTPEVFQQAAHAGYDVYFCGHTHGGQICLPGGIPLMCNVDAPREYCSGNWRYQRMQGYTSKGSGVSVVDVRFNCPPEITLHTLRKAS
ncbi:MAG: metallophosphoesterase [bacterium]